MHYLFKKFTYKEDDKNVEIALVDCPDYDENGCVTIKRIIKYDPEMRNLDRINIVLVRPTVYLPISTNKLEKYTEDLREIFSEFFTKATVFLLYTNDFTINLSKLFEASKKFDLTEEKKLKLIKWLQQKELKECIDCSNSLFYSSEKFRYRLQDNKFYNMFLRVGNVQTSRQVLDMFFFWLLPHLKGVTGTSVHKGTFCDSRDTRSGTF